MANQVGIAITIKAWLPAGKGLDEQFTALSLVKTAHESGDYAPLLAAAKIEAVQTEQKTRREQVEPAAIDGNQAIAETPEPVQQEILSADMGDTLPNPIKGKKAA